MSTNEQKLRALSASIAGVSQSIRAAGSSKQKHLLRVRELELSLQSADTDSTKEAAAKDLSDYTLEYDSKASSALTVTLLSTTYPEAAQVTISCSQPIADYVLTLDTPVTISGIKKSLATIGVTVKDGSTVLGEGEAMDVEPLCKVGVKAVEEIDIPANQGTEGEEGGEGGGSVKLEFSYNQGTGDAMEELRVEYEKLEKERREVINALRREKALEMSAQGGEGQAVKRGFLNGGNQKKSEKGIWGKIGKVKEWGMEKGMKVWRFKNFLLFFGVVGMVGWKGDELALPEPV